MKKTLNLIGNESGITALETAIILIAFVVVAAIFSFTILTTGTFLTEKSKEAAYAGLQEVQGSMVLKGSVIARGYPCTIDYMCVSNVELTLSPASGGSSVDLSTGAALAAKVQITFRDADTNQNLTPALGLGRANAGTWRVATCLRCQPATGCEVAGDCILPAGGLAVISIGVPLASEGDMTAYHAFAIEIKPPLGGTMLVERTLPAEVYTNTDLN